MRDVTITGDGIRLGQFLKLADAVEAGSDVKFLLADGEVTVNGAPETRRGRQLARGDVVRVGEIELRVS
ncbi:MAG TPA: RNA-binding S4 domain-containing protein [Kineosporiaceae bacterium]|jgi:ribosome-associated protein|nr:RNA-binding S4 domain-containing protein [Kineosporiaceae bacterium]